MRPQITPGTTGADDSPGASGPELYRHGGSFRPVSGPRLRLHARTAAVDNETGELVPGAFANVRFDLRSTSASLSIPASALIFDSRGARVATIGSDNRVALEAGHDRSRSG